MPSADLAQLPALLDRYERPLVRYAQSILGDLDAARDVVQDTFIRWVQRETRADSAETPGPLSEAAEGHGSASQSQPPALDSTAAWLFTVCRNRALDHQ